MRAYHRVDPLMDERKGHYTPAQFGAFLKVQLVAGRQTERGYFRSVGALKALLPSAYARYVDFLVAEGDIVLRGERIYVDGWREWQEGDLTVSERMVRLRNRHRNVAVTGTVTPASHDTDPPLSPHTPLSPPRVSVGISSPPVTALDDDEPELPALSWLTQHGCYVAPVSGYYRQLVMAVENHGADALIGKFEALRKAGIKKGDIKGYLFGAIDALRVKPDLKAIEQEERAEQNSDAFSRRVEATRREQARIRGESA